MKNQFCNSRWLAMRPLIAMALVTVACTGMLASWSAHAADTEVVSNNAQRGKELFISNGCFACHGYNGQGGSYTGVRIAPDPLPWQAIAAFIRLPRGVTPPYLNWPFNVMPPFTAELVPDKDVQDIYAYLKSIPGPTDIKNIPSFKK